MKNPYLACVDRFENSIHLKEAGPLNSFQKM